MYAAVTMDEVKRAKKQGKIEKATLAAYLDEEEEKGRTSNDCKKIEMIKLRKKKKKKQPLYDKVKMNGNYTKPKMRKALFKIKAAKGLVLEL